jgi:Pectate lyase superfamily protein
MKKQVFKFLIGILFTVFTSSLYAQIGENIEDYGADGTDTTDDHTAILSAISAAVATGGSKVVIIPEGSFRISQAIALVGDAYDKLTIKGIGKASILVHTAGDCAIKLGDGTSSGAVQFVTLKDFQIKGDGNSSASAGIYVYRAHRNIFSNLFIWGYGSTSSGSDSEGGACIKFKYSWIQTVRECALLASRYGVYLCTGGDAANNLNIVDCVIESIAKTGIHLNSASGIKISGCCIEGGTMEYGVYAVSGRSYAVQNNYFEGISEAAVYLENSAYLCAVTISGNYIRMSGTDYAINLYGVQSAQISGNMFSGIPNEDVIKTRARGYVQNVWLTGNEHYPGDGETLWDGYDYIKKYDSSKLFFSGMWEDLQNKKLIYGSQYSITQDSI